MNSQNPASATPADPRPPHQAAVEALTDPATDPATLNLIASTWPDLLPGVAAHPNCYPDLGAWITNVTDGAVQYVAASPAEPAPEPAPEAVMPEPVVPEPVVPEAVVPEAVVPEPTAPELGAPELTGRSEKLRWIGVGIAIGLVTGGLLAVLLVLFVLPGLFGSVL